MTLQDALNYFKNLESETTKMSEIKFYQKFIQVLTSLEHKYLPDSEVQSIDQELDALNINSTAAKNKKYFSSASKPFQKYLKDIFSLTTKGYYSNMGLGLGTSF